MIKKYFQPIVLTTVLAALVAWYFGYEKKIRIEQEAKVEGTKQLVGSKRDAVQEISIEKPSPGYPVKLKKTGEVWALSAPVEDAADAASVSGLISALTNSKYEDAVEENPKDIEKYGLKNPSLTVSVFTQPGTPPEQVMFGSDTPVGGAVYVKTSRSTTVYRAPLSAKSPCDKTATDLRERAILSLARSEVSEIEIQNTKGTVLLTKGEKDRWNLPRENLPTDPSESTKLINSILDAKAATYVDEKSPSLSTYGLTTPKIKIWITHGKDRARVSLALGKAGDKVFLRRKESTIFGVGPELWNAWDVTSASLRSKDLVAFNRFDISRVKIERKTDSLDFSRPLAGWQFPSEPSLKIDPLKVDGWLTSLQDMKIKAYGDKKGKVTAPSLTVRLFEKKEGSEAEKVTLKFSSIRAGQVSIERSGFDGLLFISEDDFRKLDQRKADFLKVEKPAEPAKDAEKKS